MLVIRFKNKITVDNLYYTVDRMYFGNTNVLKGILKNLRYFTEF